MKIKINSDSDNMKPKTVSIIGGTGKMGSLFRPLFEKEGCNVIVSGRDSKITPEEAAKKGDIVIVTVPIRYTIDIIKKIGPYVKKEALLTDFTSVKIEPVKAMLKYSEAEVVGGHPVFGPSVELRGQDYVLCPAREGNYISWFKEFLKRQGLNIIEITPEEHDKKMGIIQCLTHLSAIAVGDVLRNMDIDVEETLKLASPVYRLRMGMIGRILNQDAELYSDIQMFNPVSAKIAEEYRRSIEKISEAVKNKDSKEFETIFKESSEHLGGFCKKAQEETDYLIKKLAERGKQK